jgi:hypothetical protein
VNARADEALPFTARRRRLGTLAEVLCIFAVFCLQGAWPVPDVNEPYYLGKAIHYWNPDWIPGDFFLQTADTHRVFNLTFGWLSLLLSPVALAWTGRVITWALLAWSWQRLSFALLPRPWFSVLSGALVACLLERCHMAGEWVIGGVEAKCFAYVLVFLGLEAFAKAAAEEPVGWTFLPVNRQSGRNAQPTRLWQNPWNRAWVLFGAAGLFHVLVGGWSAVAAAFAWRMLPQRPSLRSMAPGLTVGLLLALPSLYSSAVLDRGASPAVVRQAHEIYVFGRLQHHLDPSHIVPSRVVRFAVLTAVFALLAAIAPEDRRSRALELFVVGTLAIALVGVVLDALAPLDPGLAAGWLRFYWFRLSDVAVPVGVALLAMRILGAGKGEKSNLSLCEARKGEKSNLSISEAGPAPPKQIGLLPFSAIRRSTLFARVLGALAVLAAAWNVGDFAWQRAIPTTPRSDPWVKSAAWREVCTWIAQSGEIPKDARFLTPRNGQSFKWYARRAEVANWKEIPQDAQSIVAWWDRLQHVYGTGSEEPGMEWYSSLAQMGADRLRKLGAQYSAEYVLTETWLRLPLKVLYENEAYAVYRLDER